MTEKMPKFAGEAEEAAWYAEHRDDLDRFLKPPNPEAIARRAEHRERVKRGRPAVDGESRSITIRVPEHLLERAQALASSKGLPYQTFLKMLITEGVQRAEASAGQG